MHLADGVVSAPVLMIGTLAAVAVIGGSIRKSNPDQIPQMAVFTALFFVVSLIHIPLGPTSIHLVLNGMMGILLGWSVIPCLFVALLLQAILLQHGGITVLGINVLIIGLPALGARLLYRFGTSKTGSSFLPGFTAGLVGVLAAAGLMMLGLLGSAAEFQNIARLLFVAYLPQAIIEGVITGFTVQFILQVQPDLLTEI